MQFNGIDFDTYFKNYPSREGFYGNYGGAYVSEDLKKITVLIKRGRRDMPVELDTSVVKLA